MDHSDDARTTRTGRRTLPWRAAALSLLTAGALAGCGGHATGTASSGPAAPLPVPSVDDASGTVLPPTSATTDPSASASAPATDPTAAAPGTGTTTGADPDRGAVTGASGAQARTVPGVADGAVALPPSAVVPADGRCRIPSLRLDPVDLQGSPGGSYADFRLVNVSSSACAVRGYVTATLIGNDGKDLVTSMRHEDGPEVWVRIAPKGSAQFHLRFPNPGSSPCNPPNAARVRIGLADVSGALTGATPEGGIQACNGELSTAPIGST